MWSVDFSCMGMSPSTPQPITPRPVYPAQSSSAWGSQKSDLARDAAADLRKIADTAGARGFLAIPGTFLEALLDAETDLKLKLAAANLALTKEELQRQLRWTEDGVKTAVAEQRRLWETEKARLLNQFQSWATELRRARALDSETVAREALAIDANRTLLLTLKTEMDKERERLRQQVVAAGSDTFTLERQLQDARAETLEKRLEVIPLIQEIVGVEEGVLAERAGSLLTLEREKAAALADLVRRKTDELVPLRQQMAEIEQRYAEAVRDAAGSELEMIREQLKQAQARLAAAVWDRAFLSNTLAVAQLKLEIQEQEDANRRQGIENDLDASAYQDTAQINATREGVRLEVGTVKDVGGARDAATFSAPIPPTVMDLRAKLALAEADWNATVRLMAKQHDVDFREWETLCGERESANGTLSATSQLVGSSIASWSGRGIKNIQMAINGALSELQGDMASRANFWDSLYSLIGQDDV